MGSEDLGDGREWETNETGGSRCEPGERLEARGYENAWMSSVPINFEPQPQRGTRRFIAPRFHRRFHRWRRWVSKA